MAQRANLPWWLSGGTESCHTCTRLYHYEIERRCVACDRGLCPSCLVIERVTGEVWCRDCLAEREE